MINLQKSLGEDKISIFGYLKAQPVAEGEPNEDTMWKLLISRFLIVTYQQRNSLILKPKHGRENNPIYFLVLFFPRHFYEAPHFPWLLIPSFSPRFTVWVPWFCRTTPALTQHSCFLGNDDFLRVVTYRFQGLGFHGYNQLRTIHFYLCLGEWDLRHVVRYKSILGLTRHPDCSWWVWYR